MEGQPWQSAAAIGLGQGAIGFLAGWAAAAPLAPTLPLAAGAASAAFTALGLYPVTQVFQVDEDRARGDRTLAVALGPARALRFGALCLAAGGAASAVAAAERFGAVDAALVACGYVALFLSMEHLARTLPRLGPVSLYRRAGTILNAATAALLLFLGGEALLR